MASETLIVARTKDHVGAATKFSAKYVQWGTIKTVFYSIEPSVITHTLPIVGAIIAPLINLVSQWEEYEHEPPACKTNRKYE